MQISTIIDTLIRNNKLSECLIWIAVFGIMIVSNTAIDFRLSILTATSIEIGLIAITYTDRYILIPKLLEKKGTAIYLLVSVVMLAAMIPLFTTMDQEVTNYYIDNIINSPDDISLLDTNLPSEKKVFFPQDMVQDENRDTLLISTPTKIAVLFICAFFLDFMLYYSQKKKKEEAIKVELEKERNEMELRFLRSQINPHFLFNSLNNIYSMVYMNDKNAPDSILILSEMLRYVTDESKQSHILLREEIKYIENYIKFQQFSYENSLNLIFEKDVESELVYISPMMLEPFVENGFKYSGLGASKDAFLRISLKTTGNKLYFSTSNSKGSKGKKGKTEREGVGIKNVEKRLQLLYPTTHKLEIEETENTFSVKLELLIEKNIKTTVKEQG
ncbi:MAG: sensor histidine kinase [Paludibacteraceae bacterium]|nr:sensor histidine kinase [Paludibacteraceae bacterium]MCR5569740.1 sensor histidine kinase [Paludibacteraceae bacterium]